MESMLDQLIKTHGNIKAAWDNCDRTDLMIWSAIRLNVNVQQVGTALHALQWEYDHRNPLVQQYLLNDNPGFVELLKLEHFTYLYVLYYFTAQGMLLTLAIGLHLVLMLLAHFALHQYNVLETICIWTLLFTCLITFILFLTTPDRQRKELKRLTNIVRQYIPADVIEHHYNEFLMQKRLTAN